MTATSGITQPHTCPFTGEPFVRRIAFRDATPPKPHEAPVQVSQRFYFDGVAPEAHVHSVDATAGKGQALMVTLYVAAEDVAAPFKGSDGVFVPPAIAGRVFMCPPLDDQPWELVELPDPWDATVVREWVRCTVYVAEFLVS